MSGTETLDYVVSGGWTIRMTRSGQRWQTHIMHRDGRRWWLRSDGEIRLVPDDSAGS